MKAKIDPQITRAVRLGDDHNFLLRCEGSRFASLELPSGDKVEKVDGKVWRVRILKGPVGDKYPLLVQEDAP
jgi:hypothetical protein